MVDASACFLIQVQDGYWAEKLVVGDSYIVHHPYINQLGVMVVYNGKNSVSISLYHDLLFIMLISIVPISKGRGKAGGGGRGMCSEKSGLNHLLMEGDGAK